MSIKEEWIFFILQRMAYQEDCERPTRIPNFSSWRKSFISTSIFVDHEG